MIILFLADVINRSCNTTIDDDDVNDDPEYNFVVDDEQLASFDDQDELRMDRATEIPSK
jgi:hypothetical protein